MPAIELSEARKSRGELQSWYLTSLRPKVASAARSGVVTAAAAAALDRQLCVFLDIPESREEG
ncbi:MAG TPA: hypothetical protein VFI04_03500 [Gaiellaceae bacterium]|jgi:hypothetical protein|nr:hypothetical protein [Gaiellaceae bacterium]